MRQCADCRDGEHENMDNNIRLVFIRDPDSMKIIKRAYICESHVEMYAGDGYQVIDCKTKRNLTDN